VPVLAGVVVLPCAACRASTNRHGRRPSIYREGEPTEGWGNPEGVPRVADRFAALRFLQALDLSTVLGAPILVFIYLKKAICSKLLVGAVDNPGKLGSARVCGLWKSRARDRLHVSPGQITRKRGTDYTLRISRIGRNPFGGGLSGRGTDYTWITLAIHKVCPQARAVQRGDGDSQSAPGRRLCRQRWGSDLSSCTGDAGTVASSSRCRHQHDAQRCRDGMTKGIEARRGRDLEQGSMRSTKARPRPRRGEPITPWALAWAGSTAWPRWCGECAARTASRPALRAFLECGPALPGRTTGLLSGASGNAS